ncbi:MAG TPA: hypothetical protein VKB51_01825 [bacterium]|nr:hypothetical protein [bacterium]
MSAPVQGRIHPRVHPLRTPLALACGLGLVLAAALAPRPLHAQQLNFEPLERGDYTEVEQKLIMLRGLEVGADYALQVRNNNQPDLPADLRNTTIGQDLRLNLDTVYDRDAHIHLSLEMGQQGFSSTDLRTSTTDTTGRVNDSQPTSLNVREAYLRYNFNPRSGLIMGKQELSLGDRRGMLFDALVPAFTFDCQVGTWCMPFGVALIGQNQSDAVTHWALQYNAYDTQDAGVHDKLQVEVFRLRYTEGNVPLGLNLGPARYNPADPIGTAAGGGPDPSQLLDTGTGSQAVYYNAHNNDYYGFRVDWLGGPFFVNFDMVAFRGERSYHLYDNTTHLTASGDPVTKRQVRGTALQTEIGYRFEHGRTGIRIMNATGDGYQADGYTTNGYAQNSYNRDLAGYYEITPGSYAGTRLWFNGANTSVDKGSGLGHSINNTRLMGWFLDWADKDKRRLGYSGGVYALSLNNPIPDSDGKLQSKIGVEWDNMLTWYFHKAIKLQVEANAILAGGAFRPNDYSTPQASQRAFYQAIARLVYSF